MKSKANGDDNNSNNREYVEERIETQRKGKKNAQEMKKKKTL